MGRLHRGAPEEARAGPGPQHRGQEVGRRQSLYLLSVLIYIEGTCCVCDLCIYV